MLSEEKKQDIKERFIQKTGKLTCPMCQKSDFSVTDGFILEFIQEKPTSFALDSSNLGFPTIGLICDNCGFLSQHTLSAIMSKEEILNG